MPAQWCLLSGPEIELSVTVDRGSIVIYVMDLNAEIFVEDGAALTEWLDANEGLFLGRPSMAAELFDDLLAGGSMRGDGRASGPGERRSGPGQRASNRRANR